MLGDSISDFVTTEARPFRRPRYNNEGENKFDGGLRLKFIQLFILGCFLFLFAGLINNQIFAGSYYRSLADGNRIRQVSIHAARGIVFDRNGTPVTINLPSFRLIDCSSEGKCQSSSVSKDQAITLEANGLGKNQRLEVDSSRYYPTSKILSHVLGYVSEISQEELKKDGSYLLGDKIGRGGIEQQYEATLRGKNGKELIEVDATGQKLRTISTFAATSGENLTMPLDLNLQKVAYTALADRKGAVVVTKPSTGEIIALVSSPTFDPNYFTDLGLSKEVRSQKIQSLFEDPLEPLFNRAISGSFPPGSTFKLITATAGLETGAIKSSTIIEDTGVLVVGPYKFPNWKWLKGGGVEGNLDIVGAIQKSNDIFFYKTAELIGIDNLVTWAKKFGLGHVLGVDLPEEAAGLIKRDREWYLGDTYHEGIGQGDLLVTPLQTNTWTNVIANGGKLCRPHLLGKPECKDLGIRKETIDTITKGMMAACSSGGTGYPLFGFKPAVACKTGTAEFGTQDKTHAWFTVFVDDLSITVLVEGAGEGSDVAAPIAKKILEEWFRGK